MSRDTEVRLAGPQDAHAIAEIHVRSWRATYQETLSPEALQRLHVRHRLALWTRRLATPATGQLTLLSVVDGQPVGFLLLGPTPDDDHDPKTTGQVLAVHVEPQATGNGAGSALLRRAVTELARVGFTRVTLWVVITNDRARRFYEREGWLPDGARRREPLAMPGEVGEVVTVVRYALPIPSSDSQARYPPVSR